jgi:lysozyme
MNFSKLVDELIIDEGEVLKMYLDSLKIPTIGIGHNLRDKPISKRASRMILEDDIADTIDALDKNLPWWNKMDDERQNVLVNMCFNMGIGTLLQFKNTLKAMEDGLYEEAAEGMANSLWAKQVGSRADRLIKIMKGNL